MVQDPAQIPARTSRTALSIAAAARVGCGVESLGFGFQCLGFTVYGEGLGFMG